ncbi:hypothetical protein HK405_014883, partial [Cladochytrium tenue]
RQADGSTAVDVSVASEGGRTPRAVARLNAAHVNAAANVPVALGLGLVYVVIAKPSAAAAARVFGLLTAARLVHSLAYVAGVQPWRSISYIVASVEVLEMAFHTATALLA